VAQFTVTAGAAGDAEGDAPPGPLPFTGARSPLLLAIGGGLLVAGAALLALVRRRQAPAR
jgi:LPXTG-motif cell wall-anchored protein